MAQHRWIAIMCLALLLYRFTPIFSECIVNDEGEAKEKEDETDQEQDDHSKDVQDDAGEATPGKRHVLSGLAPLLIKGLKMGLKVGEKLATAVDLSVKIPVAIGGCQTWYPSIQDNWDRVKQLSKQLKNITSQIDEITLKAAITQCYAKSGLRQYKKTRERMEKLSNTEKLVFNSMSPELGKALRSSTEHIKEVIRKKSGTADEVDAIQVESMYSSGLQKAFKSVEPVLTLAIPGFKEIYEHIKKTVIGSKIIELEEDLDVELGFKGSPSEHQELSGSKFLAIKNPDMGKRVRAAVTEVIRKYNAAHDLYEEVAENADGIFQALSIAMSVWSTIDTIKNCEKKRDDTRESAQNLEQLVANSTKYLEKTKKSYQQGQEAWKQIVDVAWEDAFLYAIEKVKKMMAEPAVTKDEGLSSNVVQAVQDYINATDNTGSPSNANKLQRKLAYAVPQAALSLECHKIKADFFYKVSQKCADGIDTFEGIYDSVKNDYNFDSERYKCAVRTGNEYVSIEGLESAWKESTKANSKVKCRCLQNNQALVDMVKQELRNGATPDDAARIASNLGDPHYQDDIEVLLRTLPNAEETLPIGVQSLICNVKDMISDEQEGYEVVRESYPGLTLEMYKSQDCSKLKQ